MTALTDKFATLISGGPAQAEATALQIDERACTRALKCAGAGLLAAIAIKTEQGGGAEWYRQFSEGDASGFDLPALLLGANLMPFTAGVARFAGVETEQANRLVRTAGQAVCRMLHETITGESLNAETFATLMVKEKDSLPGKVPGNLVETLGVKPYREENTSSGSKKITFNIIFLLMCIVVLFFLIKYCK